MGGIRANESSVKRHPVCWSQTESGNRGAGIQQTISHQGRARHFVPPPSLLPAFWKSFQRYPGQFIGSVARAPCCLCSIFCLQTAPNSRPTSRGKPEPLPWDFSGELQPTCSFVRRRTMYHLPPTPSLVFPFYIACVPRMAIYFRNICPSIIFGCFAIPFSSIIVPNIVTLSRRLSCQTSTASPKSYPWSYSTWETMQLLLWSSFL